MAGAEESLYIKYAGETTAKLVICEAECEFVDRSGFFASFLIFFELLI